MKNMDHNNFGVDGWPDDGTVFHIQDQTRHEQERGSGQDT